MEPMKTDKIQLDLNLLNEVIGVIEMIKKDQQEGKLFSAGYNMGLLQKHLCVLRDKILDQKN